MNTVIAVKDNPNILKYVNDFCSANECTISCADKSILINALTHGVPLDFIFGNRLSNREVVNIIRSVHDLEEYSINFRECAFEELANMLHLNERYKDGCMQVQCYDENEFKWIEKGIENPIFCKSNNLTLNSNIVLKFILSKNPEGLSKITGSEFPRLNLDNISCHLILGILTRYILRIADSCDCDNICFAMSYKDTIDYIKDSLNISLDKISYYRLSKIVHTLDTLGKLYFLHSRELKITGDYLPFPTSLILVELSKALAFNFKV